MHNSGSPLGGAMERGGLASNGRGHGPHIKGLEAPPRRESTRVWDAMELERAVERERSGRLAAEARAAELQARLLDAQDEIARLREQLAAGGGLGRPNDEKPWRPRPSTGSARGADPHASPQQRPFSVSAAAAGPEHLQLYVTQASSPPAQPPPPMSSGAVSSYVSFPGAAHWPRSVSTDHSPVALHADEARLRLRPRPVRRLARQHPRQCAAM